MILLQVFLEIRDALPDSLLSHSRLSVKPRYSIVLVSPTPLKWIVSIKGNETDFILYVSLKLCKKGFISTSIFES